MSRPYVHLDQEAPEALRLLLALVSVRPRPHKLQTRPQSPFDFFLELFKVDPIQFEVDFLQLGDQVSLTQLVGQPEIVVCKGQLESQA